MINIGIIGLGHWGPNLLRNFSEHPEVAVRVICDREQEKQCKLERYGIGFTTDYQEVVAADNGIDTVVIATPLSTHYDIVRAALSAGKNVFVEKPVAPTAAMTLELVKLAEAGNLCFMVGHVFMYNAGIRFVKEQIEQGELGEILFIHGQRTNLGPVRNDASALWDLAAHDISIFNYWLDRAPVTATAVGSCVLNPDIEDVVSATFSYSDNVKCNILASWLHPNKVRRITVVGSERMLVWDDMSNSEPVKIYDKSIHRTEFREQVEGTLSEFRFSIQDGQVMIPRIKLNEPLREECNHFVECLLAGKRPLSDGRNGYRAVAALEAACRSMQNNAIITRVEYVD